MEIVAIPVRSRPRTPIRARRIRNRHGRFHNARQASPLPQTVDSRHRPAARNQAEDGASSRHPRVAASAIVLWLRRRAEATGIALPRVQATRAGRPLPAITSEAVRVLRDPSSI